jgi:hypothetical protein
MRFLKSIGASALLALTLVAVAAVTGCSGSSKTSVVPDPSATVGLPTPAAAGPVNTYTGTQTPGEWSFTLDNTDGKFSYQPVTYPATATTGTITTANGFTVLSTGGYALEIEGRAAILLPGDSTNAPVFGVPQTECYDITGKLRFQYQDTLGNGYGSIVASTDTTGASWAFEDLEGSGSGPAFFFATCSTSSGLSTINFTGTDTLLDSSWYGFGTTSKMHRRISGSGLPDSLSPTRAIPLEPLTGAQRSLPPALLSLVWRSRLRPCRPQTSPPNPISGSSMNPVHSIILR